MTTVFVGVTQNGVRQREGHIEAKAETMLHIGACGYGWAGNVDLFDLEAIEKAREDPYEIWNAPWSGDQPTPVRWVAICRRCQR